MGDYYNATRGPLAATLADGSAVSIGPKRWMFIPPDKEGSSSVLRLVDKGFLVRSKVPITVIPEPVVEVPIQPAPESATESTPEASKSEKPSEEKPAAPGTLEASTSSVKEEISRKKR